MLSAENVVLIIIDVQDKLAKAMYEKEALLENLQRLVIGFKALGIPIMLSEQNPQRLGPTILELYTLLTDVKPVTKLAFSCCREERFEQELKALHRRQMVVTGIETHVCVYQTCVDLLNQGYEVQVVADAVSSRTMKNRDIGLERIKSEGVKITSTEMLLFELLQTAGHPSFKEVQKVIK